MCSRAERKRRRRAARLRVVETDGAWFIHAPSRGGTSEGLRSVLQTRTAPVLSLPFVFPPSAKAAFVDLAAATGDTVENIERAARSIVDAVGLGPDDCARCGHWRKEHGNKGYGGPLDGCNHVADGPDGAEGEGAACDCPAFVRGDRYEPNVSTVTPGYFGSEEIVVCPDGVVRVT